MARLLIRLIAIGVGIVACGAASAVWAVTVTDTTTADFAAGTLGACYAGESGDGEILLSPTEGTEFFGSALEPDWILHDWSPPDGANTTSVGGGVLTDNMARINRDPLSGPSAYGPGRSLEFVAVFGAQSFQHVGFGGGDQSGGGEVYNGPPWIMFSTGNQNASVLARVHNGGGLTDVAVAPIDGLPHRYRIDWSATQADFFIDDLLVSTNTANPVTANMRPAISDVILALPALTVDWIRMTPYTSPCSFLSAVVDGGNAAANWTTLVANGLQPPGATFTLETRSGNTAVPNGSWSPFAAVGMAGAIASPNRRYLQYRATLATTDPDQTAELEDVSISYDACTPSGPEICDNGIDDDCDGVQTACTPTPTPTVTPVPPTHTATVTATATATRTHTATATHTAVDTATATDTPTATATRTNTPTSTPGLCGNGNVDAGEQCDDGNTDNGDCCNSTCHFEPNGAACNDHNTCTTGETCNAFGVCRGFTACQTTLTCDFCGSKCKLTAGVCKCGG
jgi:cysteine-rich repeat protein